jgi:hypothetical protein
MDGIGARRVNGSCVVLRRLSGFLRPSWKSADEWEVLRPDTMVIYHIVV